VPAPLWPLALYAAVFALYAGLPARRVKGYVAGADGQKLTYRLNGPLVMAVCVGTWALACLKGLMSWNALYLHRWEMVSSACALGLAFTLWVVLPAPRVPTWGLFKELYLGRSPNPQWLGRRVDAKMFLYLLGAVVLELNVLSFTAHHLMKYSEDASPGVVLYAGLFTFFLVEYLVFEEVHLYTYDFVAESVGFKLGWGCFVFYPFFYAVGLWSVADLPNPHEPAAWLLLCAALFFAGWVLARGANLQKFFFKKDPSRRAFGLIEPKAIDGRVLASGFWGLSRHINYLGELCMATALALCLGYPRQLGPWLYPLYYLVLLLPRQRDDDRRCAAKYGAAWAEYCRQVPYRIIPFIY
jgi:delta14-sterol reductase